MPKERAFFRLEEQSDHVGLVEAQGDPVLLAAMLAIAMDENLAIVTIVITAAMEFMQKNKVDINDFQKHINKIK